MGKRKRNNYKAGAGADGINFNKKHQNMSNNSFKNALPLDYDQDDDGGASKASGLFSGIVKAPIDPNSNQRGAFPGLDDDEDDVDFVGPPVDGLQYLRMVR